MPPLKVVKVLPSIVNQSVALVSTGVRRRSNRDVPFTSIALKNMELGSVTFDTH